MYRQWTRISEEEGKSAPNKEPPVGSFGREGRFYWAGSQDKGTPCGASYFSPHTKLNRLNRLHWKLSKRFKPPENRMIAKYSLPFEAVKPSLKGTRHYHRLGPKMYTVVYSGVLLYSVRHIGSHFGHFGKRNMLSKPVYNIMSATSKRRGRAYVRFILFVAATHD